jgi:hypothetical protein
VGGEDCGNLVSPNDLIKEPTPAHMQLSPRQMVVQFGHILQQDLFPRIASSVGPLSAAILVRERFPETAKQKAEAKRVKKAKKKGGKAGARKGAKHVFAKAKATERGTRIQQQRKQKLVRMLKELPRQCDIGTKTSSKGHQQYWRGYKLHLDVADGQLPISAVLTSASVHDSQVAIPLMTMTSQRVVHLYELMDSAYDADPIPFTPIAGSSIMFRSSRRTYAVGPRSLPRCSRCSRTNQRRN